jgi:hypothetical protein
MTPVIKISNRPFNEDLCPDLGNMWSWCLMYRYKIDNSVKFQAFADLESAKAHWLSLLTDDYRVPLVIQVRAFHLYHCPDEWFNCSECADPEDDLPGCEQPYPEVKQSGTV